MTDMAVLGTEAIRRAAGHLIGLRIDASTRTDPLGRFEACLSQLQEVLSLHRAGIRISFVEFSRARLMVEQLDRWLMAYKMGALDPDKCRPKFPLAEIERFAVKVSDRAVFICGLIVAQRKRYQ